MHDNLSSDKKYPELQKTQLLDVWLQATQFAIVGQGKHDDFELIK
jgi:hypothetical protein